jgi:UDP-N-acetylglucosamine--N-acetylmuramyl-(pentapeptide) pyrophosphoryl-undecaprenol N-acetylglucosamine transferase
LLARCEIIHQCGEGNFESFKQMIADENLPGFFLSPFLSGQQMRHAFAAADLVISRAGAGSIAEIAALGKPSITIPLPKSAADHQSKNALDFARTGATLVLEQMNLTPHLFQNRVFALLDNPDLLANE